MSASGRARSALAGRTTGRTASVRVAASGLRNATPPSSGNVVQLHPGGQAAPPAAAAPVQMPAVSTARTSSTAAARERRRHVLMGLTGVAFVTLLAAIFSGGIFVALHVAADALLVGYVILLVRYRQIAMDRVEKVEPIRPPVTEQAPASIQLAPSYLVRSGT